VEWHEVPAVYAGHNVEIARVSNGNRYYATVSGTAIAASSKASSYQANNFLYIGNGTDQKWFDGTTLRDSGLRALPQPKWPT
jgi:hypothetical protein